MKRSRTGCSVCKLRKVRCDERVDGGCRNCERLRVKCPGRNDSAHVPDYVPVKVAGACATCRTLKLRCSRERPACASCQKRRLVCKYEECAPSKGAGQGPALAVQERDEAAQADAADLFDSNDMMRRLVDAYFQHIAPVRSMAFVDHAQLLQAIDQDSWKSDFGEAFMLAICCLGLRSSTSLSSELPRAEAWINISQGLALQSIGLPTFMTLATLALLVEHHLSTGSKAAAFMLTASCSRMAHLLQLHDSSVSSTQGYLESETSTAAENRVRLLWACRIHDIVISSGIESFELSRKPPKVPFPRDNYPGDETSDAPAAAYASSVALGSCEPSLAALTVNVFEIRHTILKLIREVPTNMQPWDASSAMMKALVALENSEQSLPLRGSYLDEKETQGLATGALFNLHLYFHQCYCDLLRVSLPGYKFPVAQNLDECPMNIIHSWQTSCLFHAERVADLLQRCQGCDGLDHLLLPTFAYESSKILAVFYAICLKEKTRPQRATAVQRINSNLLVINRRRAAITDMQDPVPESLIQFLNKLGYQDVTAGWQSPLAEPLPLEEETEDPQQIIVHPMTTFATARNELEVAKKQKQKKPGVAVAVSAQTASPSNPDHGYFPSDKWDASSVQSSQSGSLALPPLLTSEIEDFLMLDPDLIAPSHEWM